MAKLQWDPVGEHYFETGVSHCVLYSPTKETINTGLPGGQLADSIWKSAGEKLWKGVAWNGFTGLTEKPSGAEATKLWANNAKYATLRSAESFGVTIEAYTYPDDWKKHNGQFTPVAEEKKFAQFATLGQQAREAFALSYVTNQGSDEDTSATMEKWHLLWNLTASPSERAYKTMNESPEALTFSWEAEATDTTISEEKVMGTAGEGVVLPTYRQAMAPNGKVCDMSIDIWKIRNIIAKGGEGAEEAQKVLSVLETVLWGGSYGVETTTDVEAYMPSPMAIYEILQGNLGFATGSNRNAVVNDSKSKAKFSR